VRRHGWGGDIPVDDDEARHRILQAAKDLLGRHPDRPPTIAEVAQLLSVSRPTVYRYFPSSHALLVAAAGEGISGFLDDIAAHLATTTTPADAVVEGVAYTFEQISRRPDLALVLAPRSGSILAVTSASARELGRQILVRLPVDWAELGYRDADLDELAEVMLRNLQSLLMDAGDPPRRPDQLRRFLDHWLGTAVATGPLSAKA
jgi:AcrR family transcriptional regulator